MVSHNVISFLCYRFLNTAARYFTKRYLSEKIIENYLNSFMRYFCFILQLLNAKQYFFRVKYFLIKCLSVECEVSRKLLKSLVIFITSISVPKTSSIIKFIDGYRKIPSSRYAENLTAYLNKVTCEVKTDLKDFTQAKKDISSSA